MKRPSSMLCLTVFLCLTVVAQSTSPPEPAKTLTPPAPSIEPTIARRTTLAPATAGPTAEPNASTNSSTPAVEPIVNVTGVSTELGTEGVDLTTTTTTIQTTPPTIPAGGTTAPVEDCNGVVCGPNQECVDQPVDNTTPSRTCQCLLNYIRINETTCQDPAEATCETVNCGDSPASCEADAEGLFTQCICGNSQTMTEEICVVKNCENTEECHGPGDDCEDHHGGYMCMCGPGRTLNDAQTDCSDNPRPTGSSPSPTTEAGAKPSTKQATSPSSKRPTGPTKPAGSGTTKSPGKGSTKAAGKATPTIDPGSKPEPSHKSYKGPIVGLFIFLLVTTLVFIAIYLVRQRKLRNNYGRLDEDSSEGGWSAFSKNPIYRGDRDYQPL